MLNKTLFSKINSIALLAFVFFALSKVVLFKSFIDYENFQALELVKLLIGFFSLSGFLILLYLLITLKEKEKASAYLYIFILLLGSGIRFFYSRMLPFTNDEGAYLYDAYLVSKWSSPFYFSFARSPMFIYPLGVLIKLLGNGLFVGRNLNIFFSLLVCILLYRLSTMLFSRKTALSASIIFLLMSPFAFDTIYLHTQTYEYVFILTSFIFSVRGIRNSVKNYYISAAFLAISVLVREVAVFYFPLLLAAILLKKISFQKKVFTAIKASLIFSGAIVFIWSLIGFMIGFEKVYYNLFALALQRDFTESYWTIFSSKLALLLKNLDYYLPIYLLTIFSFFVYIKRLLSTKLLDLLYFILGTIVVGNFNTISAHIFYSNFSAFYFILICLFFVCSFYLLSKVKKANVIGKKLLLSIFFFVIPFTFYLFYYDNFQTEYFIEFFIPAILIIAYALTHLSEKLDAKTRPALFILIFVLGLLNVNSLNFALSHPQRGTYPVENIKAIMHVTNKNFPGDKEIFTASSAIAFFTGKSLALNISHPAIYCKCVPISDDIIFKLYPSEDQIINYLDNHKVRIIYTEKQTMGVYFTNREKIKKYWQDNFVYTQTIGTENPIDIYVRKK